jgi:hypothetical protein
VRDRLDASGGKFRLEIAIQKPPCFPVSSDDRIEMTERERSLTLD